MWKTVLKRTVQHMYFAMYCINITIHVHLHIMFLELFHDISMTIIYRLSYICLVECVIYKGNNRYISQYFSYDILWMQLEVNGLLFTEYL